MKIDPCCGCCSLPTPELMLVPDEDFGHVCPQCDLAMAEAEWDGRKEAQAEFQT